MWILRVRRGHFHVHVVPRYPGSDPTKIFLQGNFEPVSMAKQESVAEIVRAALEDCNQQANQEFTGH
jgi:diadenosine tetraphosphate (Ap4A) HIT family hydrolase